MELNSIQVILSKVPAAFSIEEINTLKQFFADHAGRNFDIKCRKCRKNENSELARACNKIYSRLK